jgi:putative transposase
MIERSGSKLSIRKQCELLSLNRSSLYYLPCGESAENLLIMRRLDELYMEYPYYGYRRMEAQLRREGYAVNGKRVRRLLRLMGLMAIYPKPKTSVSDVSHKIYPYLLRGLAIVRVGQVWSIDITYIPINKGFMYLVAIIDWYSRYVVSWELSNSMETSFCINALKSALLQGKPEIFNSDQGAQFTSVQFTQVLLQAEIQISMDGRGRALDNVFIERLWRSVKYEKVYINAYDDGVVLWQDLNDYFIHYNHHRPHQALGYKTPAEVHFNKS